MASDKKAVTKMLMTKMLVNKEPDEMPRISFIPDDDALIYLRLDGEFDRPEDNVTVAGASLTFRRLSLSFDQAVLAAQEIAREVSTGARDMKSAAPDLEMQLTRAAWAAVRDGRDFAAEAAEIIRAVVNVWPESTPAGAVELLEQALSRLNQVQVKKDVEEIDDLLVYT